ncbi:MAG TPA: hypothetical protein DE315_03480 [Candidatus Omnitrophica bacterium]|nr:MAG: hypothetical protein A2Y05_00500 [Omnitrophica WOR_2 bacterium GWA2_53_43]HBO97122.1 hypothetical protein [Candidatus Omnitrophota bacterium]HCI44576.1 hypothetical protein [Candidatus Omnitrophota bacterium]
MFRAISRVCFGIILAGGFALSAYAQDTEGTKDLQAAFGSVVKASETEIVISQYNSEQEMDQEVAYTVDPQTHLEGAATAAEIAAGEEVEILYEEMDGKKAARFISKELLPDDEMQEDYTEDEVSSNAISEDL